MSATIVDSRIFGNIFSSDAMRNIWSDENRTAKYLEIEKALALVQGRMGIIPVEASVEIVRNCDIRKIDMEKLRIDTVAHYLDRCLHRDRKSTRLNSSHGYISYAVFCLKKKKV